MLLRVFTEPQQGASYDDLLAVAQKTEECGFDALFRSGHYMAQGDGDGLPGPTDAWITMAALARETSRIRLGTLVSPGSTTPSSTYRPCPSRAGTTPVIIGGSGMTRTPALATRHAAEFNAAFKPMSETAELFARVRSACAAAGRDPETLALSVAHATVVGKDDSEVRRRLEVYGNYADEVKACAVVDTPAEVVDRLGRFAATGADRAYLQIPVLADLDHLDLIASEVLPHLT